MFSYSRLDLWFGLLALSLLCRWEWVGWGDGGSSVTLVSSFPAPSQVALIASGHLGCVCHQQWGLSLSLSNEFASYEEFAVILHPPFHVFLCSLLHWNSDKRKDKNRDSQLNTDAVTCEIFVAISRVKHFSLSVILYSTMRFWREGEMFCCWLLYNLEAITIL